MSTLASIANKQLACGGETANTGKLGCPKELATPLHLIAFKKGTVIPSTTEWNLAYINVEIQKGNYTPLIEAEAFEKMSSDDSMSTNQRGLDRLSVKGLPKYKLTFEEGHEFYKQLAKLTSNKQLDFAIGDEEGNWKLGVNADGDYVGLTAGQVIAELTSEKELGGESESKALIVQFTDRLQWDQNYVIFGKDELGWNPGDVQGANGVTLSFDSVPVTADTDIVIDAVFSSDMTTKVLGLVTTDFLVTVQGVTVPHTFAESNGQYTLTIAALQLADIVVVDLFDSTLNTQRILNNGILYSSDVVSEDTVAP